MRQSLKRRVALVSLFALTSSTFVGGVASAAVEPDAGLKNSDVWVPGTAVPLERNSWNVEGAGNNNVVQNYAANGAMDATTSIGAVNVRAEFTPLAQRTPGSAFLLTGEAAKSHADFSGAANMFFEGDSVITAPALGMLLVSDVTCATEAGINPQDVKAFLNYTGECKYGTLTFKFDRPVSDPILDFSGFGGHVYVGNWVNGATVTDDESAYNSVAVRFSSSNYIVESKTPGVQLELLNDNGVTPTNTSVNNNVIRNAQTDRRTNARCVPDSPRALTSSFKSYPSVFVSAGHPAACGSVRVRGENLTEISFDMSMKVSNLSNFRASEYGRSFSRTNLDGITQAGAPVTPATAAPDGINGLYSHPSLGPLKIFENDRLAVGQQNSDLARLTLRLPAYSIGDFVWNDADGDGVQGESENPVSDVLVELLNGAGEPVLNPLTDEPITTRTDESGKYIFNGLSHGVEYRVRFTAPDGFVLTKPNVGGAGAQDNSKADPVSRMTGVVSFDRDAYWADPSGSVKTNLSLDAGLVRSLPALDVEKWLDAQRADEPGEALVANVGDPIDVTVRVRNSGNVRLSDIRVSDDVIAADALTAPTQRRAANGNVVGDWAGFLEPGEYAFFTARVPALPAGGSHANTVSVEGTPPPSSDVPPTPITVTDKGYAEAAKLVLKKYINGDDAQDAPGVVVDGDQMTIKYVVSNPSKVHIDDIRVTDTVVASTNAGLQADITAKLAAVRPFRLAPGESKEIEITVDAPLRGVVNNHKNEAAAEGMPIGNYIRPMQPAFPGQQNPHNPLIGSPIAGKTLERVRSEVDPAHANKPAVSLGDFVWVDADQNGIQDTGESPVSGVVVELLDGDGRPVVGADGRAVTATTNALGKYLFDNLAPGAYSVKFTAPEGYAFTQRGVGADNTVNSKADPATGRSGVVEVLSDADLTVDAGVYRLPSGIEVIKRVNNVVATDANKVAVAPGETMNFSFEVRNTGEVTLRDVVLRDSKIPASAITAPVKVYNANGDEAGAWNGALAAGQYAFFTASMPAPAAGEVHENTATVQGTPPPVPGSQTPPPPVTDDSVAKVYVPKLMLTKFINNDDANSAPGVRIVGDTMVVKYVVRNAGQIDVTGISLTDRVTSPANSPLQAAIDAELAKVARFDLAAGAEKTVEITVPAPGVGEANNHANTAQASGGVTPPAEPPQPKPGEPRVPVTPPVVTSNEDPAHAHKVPVSVGDFVWVDADKDGVQGGNEKPLAGVVVELLDGQGNPVRGGDGQPMTAVTTDEGKYLFENLAPGTYKVRFQPPFGYAFTTPGQGGDPEADSNADPVSGETAGVEVLTGTNLGFDAGLYKLTPAITVIKKINGYDANTPEAAAQVATGSQMTVSFLVKNTGDTVLTDVRVADDTIDAASIVAPAMKYAADGSEAGAYAGSLDVGEYAVYVAKAPAPQVAGGTHKNTATVTGVPPVDPKNPPADPQNPPTVTDDDDAHAVTPKLVVKKYIDGADAQDGASSARVVGEEMTIKFVVTNESTVPVRNIVIRDRVTTPANSPLQGVIDAKLGQVAPFELPPLGEKIVEITVPAPELGSEHVDFGSVSGEVVPPTPPTPGKPGEPTPPGRIPPVVSEEDPAHAHKPLAALGDKVWKDADKDGVQDEGEEPLAGVKVHLLDEAGQPVVKDGTPITATTDERGEYLFDQLVPGSYKVRFEAPAGFDFTAKNNVADSGVDSDADPATGMSDTVVLRSGDRILTVDAGLIQRDPGLTLVKKINGYDANTAGEAALVAPGADMNITFVVTNTGGTIVNDVTVRDDVLKTNQIHVPAVKYGKDGVEAGAFNGSLNPDEYAVFTATIPAPERAGTLHTNTATVTGVPPLDPKNPPADPQNPPTVTDQDKGNARVPKLALKKYINEQDAQTPRASVPVVGENMTIRYVVTNESDVEIRNITLSDRVTIPADSPLQAAINAELAKIAAFNLAAGESEIVEIVVPAPADGQSHQNYATARGDIVPPAPPTPGKPGEPVPPAPGVPPVVSEEDPANAHKPLAALGDKVWKDANKDGIQNEDETPVAGVTVHLLDEEGQPVLKDGVPVTATTNEQGEYLFDNLMPGAYKVRFQAPAGFDFTGKNQGGDTGLDSDADPATGTSDTVTLRAGDRILTVDAGLLQRDPALTLVKKINGFDAETLDQVVPVAPGAPMQVSFIVSNPGGTTINDIALSDDVIPAGAIHTPTVKYHKDGTEAGPYTGSLDPDQYAVFTATIPAPASGDLHENTATVTGVPPVDPTNPPNPNDPPKPPLSVENKGKAAAAKLTLKKYINNDDAQAAPGVRVTGETMDITYRVTNAGKVSIEGITLTDRVLEPAGSPIQEEINNKLTAVEPFTLEAGQSKDITITVQAPAPGYLGVHKNTATASGTPKFPGTPEPTTPGEPTTPEPTLPPVTSNEDPAHAYSGDELIPGIDVEKYINTHDADTQDDAVAVEVGTTMNITFKVTNTGNTLLKNITLSDNVIARENITARDGFTGELKPGEVAWFDATLPAPAANALHTNTATVTGQPYTPGGDPLQDPRNPDNDGPWTLTDEDPAYATGHLPPMPPATPKTPNILAKTGATLGGAQGLGALLLIAGVTALAIKRRRP